MTPPMDNRLLRPRQRPSRTLYFRAGSSALWSTAANWYLDAAGTRPAVSLPGPTDTAVMIEAYVDQQPTPAPVVRNLVLTDTWLQIDITVLGLATLNGFAYFAFETLTGNAVLNDASSLYQGTIIGNVVLNGNASNCGTVTGTVTINGTPNPCF